MVLLAKVRSKIRIFNSRRRTLITLRWERRLPCLVIHEKYEKLTKRLLRILALIGIVSSIGLLPVVWYLNLIFVIIIVAVEQLFERAIFKYTIIYFQPLPKFKWSIAEEWVGMGFVYRDVREEPVPNVVGPVFKIESCAHEFFVLLREWNYDEREDRDNNVCLSFIYDNTGGYYTFIYPNLARHTIQDTYSEIKEAHKFNKFEKEAEGLVVQYTFCRYFPTGTYSQLDAFVQRHPKGQPFWLQPFIQRPNKPIDILFGEEPILKFHVKIKHRRELDQHEVEYQHFMHVIDIMEKK